MLHKEDITEAVCLDLVKRGYSVWKKPHGRKKGADVIAQEPKTKVKMFISTAGRAASEAAGDEPHAVRTESQVLECMTKSLYSALRTRHENKFSPGDEIVLAFPDEPGCRKYLCAEKPVLDSLGVKILVVKENKEVSTL